MALENPPNSEDSGNILLDAGSGGRASQRLIGEIFLQAFNNEILAQLDDAATIATEAGKMAISIDGYTVTPLFFPGGGIGSLAINGTVNDVSMLGAEPLYLAASFIIEEGLPIATLKAVVADMAKASKAAGIKIITGDTKVAPRGACDKLFITTCGYGKVYANPQPGGNLAQPEDAVLVSGTMGDHGLAVMAAREELSFISDAASDCAPLNGLIKNLILKAGPIHTLRDPTRGGLATTLAEIAEQSAVSIEINEFDVPILPAIAEGCSFLGLDPLYLANEGKCICILPADKAELALQIMHESPYGKQAAIIGKVTSTLPGKVIMHTRMGGQRFLSMLEGAPLPRIC